MSGSAGEGQGRNDHGDKRVGDAAARAHRQADGGARQQTGKCKRAAQGAAGDDEARCRDRPACGRSDARREGDPAQVEHRFPPLDRGEIAQFEARHPIGTKARLGPGARAAYRAGSAGRRRHGTAARSRRGVELGARKTERSTGIELAIPIHPDAARDHRRDAEWASDVPCHGVRQAIHVAGFGNWFRDQCDMAGLPHCSFHGLRKSVSVRLAEAGCTPHEIAAITGHASLKEIVRYTKTADRKRLAAAAMEKVAGERSTAKLSNLSDGLTKTEESSGN